MKNWAIFIVVLLVLASFTAISIGKEATDKTENIVLKFHDITTIDTEIEGKTYLELRMENTNGYLYHAGKPMLPLSRETITLPFGTKILDIKAEIGEIETIKLTEKILPAPEYKTLNSLTTDVEHYNADQALYDSNEPYPIEWYDYFTTGGLDEDSELKTFLTIRAFPVRYQPNSDIAQIAKSMDFEIIYEKPENKIVQTPSEYDMVIITPKKLHTSDLERLKDHKNGLNPPIRTEIKELEDIYDEFSGVDKPEEIKRFIESEINTNGIKYVLLIGGMKSLLWGSPRDGPNHGTSGWHLPVRYTNLYDQGGTYDPGTISDLYYADVFDGEGVFQTWNSDDDEIIAEYTMFVGQKDEIDGVPDVYLGRLACRNKFEVKIMVDKIIEYETGKAPSSWYNKIIGIGGDSHDDSGTNYDEGEVACDHIFETYMDDFNPVKLYSTNRDTNPSMIPSTEAIVREISEGAGFLLFEGHGHPASWNTHWHGEFTWSDTPGGIKVEDFPKFSNKEKLPVCVIGGCHNSQFNVTLLATALNKPFMWTHGYPTPECFGWWMVRKIGGGAIASLGNTGLGYGAVGNHGDQDGDGVDLPDTLEAVGGYQIGLFFKNFNEGNGEYKLGKIWQLAEKQYVETYPPMDDRTDCKTIQQWPLLGDPSLQIGGYEI